MTTSEEADHAPASATGLDAGSYMLEKGLELCRKGEWDVGLDYLEKLANREKQSDLPSLFFSYMGYGIAHRQRRIKEGLRLCKHAVKMEFFQPDNYLNLARTYLLAKNRRAAFRTLHKGLEIDADHPELVELHESLGARRPPVLPFFSRGNPLNRLLGSIRHG
ncbi:MAG: hypothetical protein GY856_26435, partial [bacterium]|nr:hypothetical protein [bacterium]